MTLAYSIPHLRHLAGLVGLFKYYSIDEQAGYGGWNYFKEMCIFLLHMPCKGFDLSSVHSKHLCLSSLSLAFSQGIQNNKHTHMKNKLKSLIAKFLGIESTIEELRKEFTKEIEAISDEANSRINDVEESASKIDDIESNVDDLVSKVEDIESAEYVGADWVTDEIESAKSDLSDELDEKVAEAIEEVVIEIKDKQVKEILEKVLTKELILKILAKWPKGLTAP